MSISARVIDSLQQLILQQGLKVGERLPSERHLCQCLSISRSSLREAVHQLKILGLLESRIGAGTFIKQPLSNWNMKFQIASNVIGHLIDQDPSYRFDVQEARLILESGTAWYAAHRATAQDKIKIRHYHEQAIYFQSMGDLEQAAMSDAKFHLAIAEASHNLVLIQLMREIFDSLQFNILLAQRKIYDDQAQFEQFQHQHEQVITAIEKKDAIGARDAVCQHIDYIIQEIKTLEENEARQKRANRFL